MSASDQDKIMHQGRRHFICSAGAAMFLAGCQRSIQTAESLPGAYWPQVEKPEIPRPLPPVAVEPLPPSPPSGNLGTPDNPIPRSRWTRAGVGRNVDPMGGINRITLHHEGWHPIAFDDYNSTIARLELIRTSHCSRGFADIGYHFIIDRAGRVYEGRPLQYQGAHVRQHHNEHNLGIMCLGNFEVQTPTDAQLRSLAATVSRLRQRFKVSYGRIYTHRELTPTACPGKNMQPRIAAMRSNNAFA